jgi:phage-related protein
MGDGYEQRTQFGLNANPAGWSLQFTKRTDAEAAAIYGFLTSMGALQSFQWTPPGESFALTFVCRQFTKAPVNGNGVDAATGRAKYLWDISAQFDQVFEP